MLIMILLVDMKEEYIKLKKASQQRRGTINQMKTKFIEVSNNKTKKAHYNKNMELVITFNILC
jgi:hypothetical protein